MSTNVTTGKVRLSYAHLFEPTTAPGSTTPKYSVSVLIDKSDKDTLAKIEAAINQAKEEGKSKWGGKIPAKLKTPLRDGDEERPDDEAYAGKIFFNCSSNRRPGVVDRALNPILDPDEVYSGCYARVAVNFYAFDTNGNRGIAVGLNHVQKLSDGERLGGGISAEAAFASSFDDDDSLLD